MDGWNVAECDADAVQRSRVSDSVLAALTMEER